ncbi:MAG: type II toxin-antitoxin system PemK/MazF family toxin [Methanosarcinales archaeon]
MERFVKGDVVVVPFPFSDLTQAKRRPALVIAELEGADLILCQITSQSIRDRYAVSIDDVILKRERLCERVMCDLIVYLQQIVTSFCTELVALNMKRLIK